jgi:hypothetical protein
LGLGSQDFSNQGPVLQSAKQARDRPHER